MRKILVLILMILLVGVTVASAKKKGEKISPPIEISRIPDGTYLGKSGGITGVKVEVTVQGGRITKIETLKARGFPKYKKRALQEMPGKIIKAQSFNVDAVTGATKSSRSIIKAVENALRNAQRRQILP